MKKTVSFKVSPVVIDKSKEQAKLSNRSLSNHIETCLMAYGKNQLANKLKQEAQLLRGIWNYLLECYHEIKGVQLEGALKNGDGETFNDPCEFLDYVIYTCEFMKKSLKEEGFDRRDA